MTVPVIRAATEADTHFIHSSWFSSLWSSWAKGRISRAVYEREQPKRIKRLLYASEVTVAYFPEVPDEVLGWACIQGESLHFAYVKGIYRKMGIARGLVEGRAKCYTQRVEAKEGRALMSALSLEYNPYKIEAP
jgi:hypothetical protein